MLSPEEIVVLRSQIEQAEQLLGQFQRQASASPQVIAALQRQIADDKAALKEAELIVSRQHSMTIQGNARVGVAVAGDVHGSIVVKQLPVRVPQYPSQEEIAAGKERIALLPIPPVPIPPVRPFLLAGLFPLRANPLFVGRDAMLQELAVALKPVGAKAAISTGIGGVGKTTLAAEFAHRYGHYFLGGVFWISCADPQTIAPQIASYGGPGGLEVWHPDEELSLDERVARVRRQWESELPRLLVFDNCDDWTSAAGELSAEVLLGEWMPHIGGSRVLVTSRRQDWSPALGVSDIQLDVLARRDSIRLLQSIASYLSDAEADQVADVMGDLPLALYLTGSYLQHHRHTTSVDQFLRELEQNSLVSHPALQGDETSYSPTQRYVQRANSMAEIRAELNVGRIFARSFDSLQASDPGDHIALVLLERASYLAPNEPITASLLKGSLSSDPFTYLDAVSRLLGLGLLQGTIDDEIQIHRLVATYVQQRKQDSRIQQELERDLIDAAYSIINSRDLNQLNILFPHLYQLYKSYDTANDLPVATLAMVLGRSEQERGNYEASKSFYQQAITIYEQKLGPSHPATATGLNNLAYLYHIQQKYDEAIPLYQQAVAHYEKELGLTHHVTATALNNLALLYYVRGMYKEALPLYQRVLSVYEQQFGLRHVLTASCLSNLAAVYEAQGSYRQARSLYERALSVTEQLFGSDHPDTAQNLNNLAVLLFNQGDYQAARPLYERALQVYEQALGRDHPDTASSLNNLASLYSVQADYERAVEIYVLVLAIRERTLGKDHPDVASALNNLAETYRAQGKFEEALPLLERALLIQEQQLGSNHLSIAGSLNNLASLYQGQGRIEEALPLLTRALDIYETSLGPDHPYVASALNNLGLNYQYQGNYSDAQPILERAVMIYQATLGKHHPNTARSLQNLASCFYQSGRIGEALPLVREALQVFENLLGLDHPDTLLCLSNIAILLYQHNALDEAQIEMEKTVKHSINRYGLEHLLTAQALRNLSLILYKQGELEEARRVAEQALVIRERIFGADSPMIAQSYNDLAAILTSLGEYQLAKKTIERATTNDDAHIVVWQRNMQILNYLDQKS
jgi:tetratricopeptide (TPR) repeat protein